MTPFKYLLSNINTIKGVGTKTTNLLKKKNINTIIDLLLSPPINIVDRTNLTKINQLHIGKIQTFIVNVKKYNFPRIKNLPKRVICEDDTGKIECVFFNSYEGYIKKILPINAKVTISGKINIYKGNYQVTNPTYISSSTNKIRNIFSSYSLTDGLGQKKYQEIIKSVLEKTPDLEEWHSEDISKKFNNISWRESIASLHNPRNIHKKGNFINRLTYDEIIATYVANSSKRRAIKKIKKINKKFNKLPQVIINKNINFDLTVDQQRALDEINNDLKSNQKMFRLLQGDVGSGKTLVALIACYNVIFSGFQVSFMAPTEILAKQHYELALKIFDKKTKITLMTGKTDKKEQKKIIDEIKNNKIDILIGTHSLFQDRIIFKKLGLIVIDEQHKFGVRQRKKLSDKGGSNCDVLVMSATPIPRTMIMTIFGDMDISLIKNKPKNRKDIKTYSKLDTKINEIISFVKNEIKNGNQVFWVCPLIEISKKVDQQSSIERFEFLKKFFKNRIDLLHGGIDKVGKEKILNNFMQKKIDILVTTTVIEVGIDFPNANVIVIENANKFGLSQLHQLRGRVGRGSKESSCILMFRSNLSENAKKRINILKKTNDGFKISEEDLKLRGYGDLLGFKQSGLQSFRFADPVVNVDLFKLAEKEIRKIEKNNLSLEKYKPLLKLQDKADVLNDLV